MRLSGCDLKDGFISGFEVSAIPRLLRLHGTSSKFAIQITTRLTRRMYLKRDFYFLRRFEFCGGVIVYGTMGEICIIDLFCSYFIHSLFNL